MSNKFFKILNSLCQQLRVFKWTLSSLRVNSAILAIFKLPIIYLKKKIYAHESMALNAMNDTIILQGLPEMYIGSHTLRQN